MLVYNKPIGLLEGHKPIMLFFFSKIHGVSCTIHGNKRLCVFLEEIFVVQLYIY